MLQQVKKNLGPIIPPVHSNAVTRRVPLFLAKLFLNQLGKLLRQLLDFIFS
jgi:hypothetical protein